MRTGNVLRAGFALIRRDAMLAVLIPAPVLIALLFRYGLPALDRWIGAALGHDPVLHIFALMLDLMLLLLVPYLLNMCAAMIMLEERDEGVSLYMAVSPPGTRGYLLGRLVIPAALATVVSILLFAFFRSSALGMNRAIPIAILASAASVAVCLGVTAFANNKVEGLALMKLGGLSMLGIQAPLFIKGSARYLFSPLPSFWMTEAAMASRGCLLQLTAGLAFSALWILLFIRAAGRTPSGRRLW